MGITQNEKGEFVGGFLGTGIAPIQQLPTGACMCDCLHVDDLMAILKEKGLDVRPAGK